jgi:hypothetical protein
VVRGTIEDVRSDVRGELRDATRTKPRRKATVAQRAARDRAGNRALALPERAQGRASERYAPGKAPSALRSGREHAQEALRSGGERSRGDGGSREIEGARQLEERIRQVPRTLSVEAAAAIRDIGRFRVVRAEALETFHAPRGQEAAHRLEIAGLKAAKLVEEVRPGGGDRGYLALTRQGRALAEKLVDEGQRVYSGAKKPRELRHDAAVYDAYQVARRDLEAAGNRVTLVRLDYQMKEELRREAWDRAYERAKGEGRNLKALPKDEQHERIKAQAVTVARAQDLPTDEESSVEYPDLQIEYERPGGEIAHCNVEVVTENYKDSQIAAKEAAGFQCFAVDVTRDTRGGAPRAPMRSLAEELLSF